MRMENDQLEKSVADMEQKYKDMVDSLASAMADLNNVQLQGFANKERRQLPF